MKTIFAVLLLTASLARAVVFTGNMSLATPYTTSEAVVAAGSLTLQAIAGEATYAAASWTVAGRLVLTGPGNYVLIATAGGIILSGGVAGPAHGTATLRLVGSGGAVVQAGRVEGNVTLLQGPAAPPPPVAAPLSNLSVRVTLAAGQTATAGLVVGGGESRRVLVRAVGPGLERLTGSPAMSDPTLTVFSGPTQVVANDDWGDAADIETAGARVGAFPLPWGSRDAAVLVALRPGPHTVEVRGAPTSNAGEVLIEVYLVD